MSTSSPPRCWRREERRRRSFGGGSDDYLVALGEPAKAVIVTGDHDLLALKGPLPVYTPPEFLDFIRG